MLIAMPSKGRAGKTKSDRYITDAVAFVPESEAKSYERSGVSQVVGVPQEIMGITKTRNWILDNADDEWVVFVDDDLKTAGWIELLEFKSKSRHLSGYEMVAEWVKLFDITEELNLRIWGIANDGATRSVYPWSPFIFHTYVTGSCMGILNRGTRFDEDFEIKEDYELCLRCITEDGGIVGARYLYWINSHWADEGGCKEYRTQEMELETIERLIKMYPGLIRQVTRGGSEFSIELEF